MWNRQRGLTLIEMIVSIVIIGVGLAGVLAAFQQAVLGSSDPVIRKQLLAIAEEMTEEILLRPYTDPQGDAYAAPTACARRNFDDIADFNGYDTATYYPPNGSICDMDGNEVPTLADYRVRINVQAATLNGLAAMRIEVIASRGNSSLTLVSYRTQWAL